MSRTVRWGSPTDGSVYEHQRSDSGVGSFSDCESRTSNTDRNFLASGYEDNNTIYTLQRALEQARQQRDEFSKKVAELETTVRQLRNEIEQNKAHVRAVTDQNELFTHEKKTLAEKNKELSEQNTQLQEELDNTIEKLKKSNRKSTSSPTAASSTTSESAEDKKPRRSASKRRPEKEKERDAEREKEKREKERKREKREKEHREHERPADKEDDAIDRLRQRFDKHRAGDESDAKSSSIASTKTARTSRPTSSYIEPLGLSTPRPQQTVPPSPARHHSYTTTGYPPSTGYASIREPSAYAQGVQRSAHPQVYIASGEYGYEEEETPYHPHQVRTGRSERR
ncbi:hypothetical protein B0T21DRAFT_380326 [Apiosordaria backusii]|uniref:Uncharacterized protein n=1 Tax=Apiosordaria backusii TaxID=314023 RepID=A0AA40K781_9PEZI|nr:hypothetical protein B0T21DRAFT_380326 [Apiosordaria backusii]